MTKQAASSKKEDLGGQTFESALESNDPTFVVLTPANTLSTLFTEQAIDPKTCPMTNFKTWKKRNPHHAYTVVETQNWDDFGDKLAQIYAARKSMVNIMVGYFKEQTANGIYLTNLQHATSFTNRSFSKDTPKYHDIQQSLANGGHGTALFVDERNANNKIAIPVICLDKEFRVKSVNAPFSYNDVNRANYGIAPIYNRDPQQQALELEV